MQDEKHGAPRCRHQFTMGVHIPNRAFMLACLQKDIIALFSPNSDVSSLSLSLSPRLCHFHSWRPEPRRSRATLPRAHQRGMVWRRVVAMTRLSRRRGRERCHGLEIGCGTARGKLRGLAGEEGERWQGLETSGGGELREGGAA